MSWRTLTAEDVLEELAPQEAAMMRNIAGNKAASIVSRAIGEMRGAIAGGGYGLGDEGSVPDGLRSDTIAVARWRWLVAFPVLAKMQTKERQSAYNDARQRMELISQQKFAPEPPTPGTHVGGGSWNSENKLVMRTHPVPRPSAQRSTTDGYANADSDAEGDV
jgi:hypothetical protein